MPAKHVNWEWESVTSYYMETSANELVDYLEFNGFLARAERKSTSISVEPYVEHKWHVLLNYRNVLERSAVNRIMSGWINGRRPDFAKMHKITTFMKDYRQKKEGQPADRTTNTPPPLPPNLPPIVPSKYNLASHTLPKSIEMESQRF